MHQEQTAKQDRMAGYAIGAVSGAGYGGEEFADTKRQPEIQSQVGELQKSVADLGMALDALYKKLCPVTRVEPEKEASTGGPIGRGTSTELGGQLSELCSRVTGIRNAAQQVTRRIEL